MNLTPLTIRELRLGSRQRSTYYGRMGTACLAVMVGAGALAPMYFGRWAPWAAGTTLVNVLGVMAGGYALVAGLIATSDAISDERSEGTLGLLFLTPLRPLEIVLSKLLGRLLTAFTSLLAVAPVFAIGLILGGVTGRTVVYQFGVVLALLLYGGSAGILASAMSRSRTQSQPLSLAVAAAPVLLAALAELLADTLHLMPGLASALGGVLSLVAHPMATLGSMAGGGAANPSVLKGATTLVLVAGFYIAAAAVVLKHSWQEGLGLGFPQLRAWFGWLMAIRRKRRDDTVARVRDEQPNPVMWLTEARWGGSRSLGVVIAVAALGYWVLGTVAGVPTEWVLGGLAVSAGVGHFWLGLRTFQGTLNSFAEDRQNGMFELLLVTPLSEREITGGKLLAVKRRSAWLFLWCILVDGLFYGAALTLLGTKLLVLLPNVLLFLAIEGWGLWTGAWGGAAMGMKNVSPGQVRSTNAILTTLALLGFMFHFGLLSRAIIVDLSVAPFLLAIQCSLGLMALFGGAVSVATGPLRLENDLRQLLSEPLETTPRAAGFWSLLQRVWGRVRSATPPHTRAR